MYELVMVGGDTRKQESGVNDCVWQQVISRPMWCRSPTLPPKWDSSYLSSDVLDVATAVMPTVLGL